MASQDASPFFQVERQQATTSQVTSLRKRAWLLGGFGAGLLLIGLVAWLAFLPQNSEKPVGQVPVLAFNPAVLSFNPAVSAIRTGGLRPGSRGGLEATAALLPTAASSFVLQPLSRAGARQLPHAGARSVNRGVRMQLGNPLKGFKNPFSGPLDGATTIKLTLAFQLRDRGPQDVLSQLEKLADSADTDTHEGLAELCQDTGLLLLRRQAEWDACCGASEFKRDDDDALAIFDKLSLIEATKFDDLDTSQTLDSALKDAGMKGTIEDGPSTTAVVCVVATLAGDREEAIGKSFGGEVSKMRTALQELSAAANNLLAFEFFFCPGPGEVLEMQDVVLDWPEIMTC